MGGAKGRGIGYTWCLLEPEFLETPEGFEGGVGPTSLHATMGTTTGEREEDGQEVGIVVVTGSRSRPRSPNSMLTRIDTIGAGGPELVLKHPPVTGLGSAK